MRLIKGNVGKILSEICKNFQSIIKKFWEKVEET